MRWGYLLPSDPKKKKRATQSNAWFECPIQVVANAFPDLILAVQLVPPFQKTEARLELVEVFDFAQFKKDVAVAQEIFTLRQDLVAVYFKRFLNHSKLGAQPGFHFRRHRRRLPTRQDAGNLHRVVVIFAQFGVLQGLADTLRGDIFGRHAMCMQVLHGRLKDIVGDRGGLFRQGAVEPFCRKSIVVKRRHEHICRIDRRSWRIHLP